MDKLGIYIPTYNRPDELGECLNSFIPQLRPFGFPIYISDNSTDDKTEKMVMKIKKRYPRIYYRKNAYMKYGRIYATNLKSVLEMGNTEFVWFFSDDDAIKKNAIIKIVMNLDTEDFLQINCGVYSKNLRKIRVNRLIKKYNDEAYDSPESALIGMIHEGYYAYIAHMIIKKKIIDAEIADIDIKQSNLDYLHTVLFYRGIVNKKSKGIFIARPLIKERSENATRFDMALINIYIKSMDKTINMLNGYYPAIIINKMRKSRSLRHMLPLITKVKLEGMDYYRYFSVVVSLNIGIVPKVILLVYALIPNPIINFLRKIIQVILRREYY
jgi:glycosyltransferase involved in cell wall biosynthesis